MVILQGYELEFIPPRGRLIGTLRLVVPSSWCTDRHLMDKLQFVTKHINTKAKVFVFCHFLLYLYFVIFFFVCVKIRVLLNISIMNHEEYELVVLVLPFFFFFFVKICLLLHCRSMMKSMNLWSL